MRIARHHRAIGDRLVPGDPLVDLHVDLSGGVMRDCPPQSTCRIFLRETARVTRLCPPSAGDMATGALLAELLPHPSTAGPPREARVAITAVVHHADWWGEDEG